MRGEVDDHCPYFTASGVPASTFPDPGVL
jgi:hypothetical protein